ncbi:MAG TPA: MmcQ/YjbR family DNA-binding protein [Terriglobales bacterium]
MAQSSSEDRRLARLTKICLRLPEATREDHGRHAGFLVRKKTFAWFMNDHHGDGIISIACKVLPGDNTALVAANPERFYPPAYLASRGWVALRLDTGKIDWEEVAELIATSYRLTAPRSLTSRLK